MMRKKLDLHKKIASTLLSVLALSGCVNYASVVKKNEIAKPSVGYVYGRFELTPQSSNNARIGLVLQETGTEVTSTMLFRRSRRPLVSVSEIKPGLYSLSKFSFAKREYFVLGLELKDSIITDRKLTKEFHVEAGKAYYVGDFLGESSVEYGIKSTYRWRIASFENNYDSTTREMTRQFPNLEKIETISVIEEK